MRSGCGPLHGLRYWNLLLHRHREQHRMSLLLPRSLLACNVTSSGKRGGGDWGLEWAPAWTPSFSSLGYTPELVQSLPLTSTCARMSSLPSENSLIWSLSIWRLPIVCLSRSVMVAGQHMLVPDLASTLFTRESTIATSVSAILITKRVSICSLAFGSVVGHSVK
jgi:hypothetical protein